MITKAGASYLAPPGKAVTALHEFVKGLYFQKSARNPLGSYPNPKNPLQFYKLNFKTYFLTMNLDDTLSSLDHIEKKPKEMNFQEIRLEIQRLGHHHIDAPSLIAEYHRKISISFASLVFILIGIPLGIFTKRGERTVQFAVALIVIVIYYLLMAGSMAVSLKGIEPIPLWIYLPNIIAGVIGIVMFRNTIES